MDYITIKGACEHNLKSIDVRIPRDKLVVITGLSGSGKSTLAFDTIYAEGQRRYVESLSAYARQFLQQNRKPAVESIDGLSPAISIEQKSVSHNPRSTVGTLTEIYDYLRLLFARIGKPYCYKCQKAIQAQTVQQIVDIILAWAPKTRFVVMAPVVRGRKGEYRKEFLMWRKAGFTRVCIDGQDYDLGEDVQCDKNRKHDIDLIIDRLVIKEGLKSRLTDSVELALKQANGLVKIRIDKSETRIFSEHFSCLDCGISYPEIAPRLFSFNSPYGACPTCDGLGHASEIDPEKLVPEPTKSLLQGAIHPWSFRGSRFYFQQLLCVAEHYEQSIDKAWQDLPEWFQKIVLYGSGDTSINYRFAKEETLFAYAKAFAGVIPTLSRLGRESTSDRKRAEIQTYMKHASCSGCNGSRLKPTALAIKIQDKSIYELTTFSIADARDFFSELKLNHREAQIGESILKEVNARLSFLMSVGLEYLSLDRSSITLSGGEAQRIRLATQVGSSLRGVIYVLDEPSIGLHQRDHRRLLSTLKKLRNQGNTVLVVEHDETTIRSADWILDIGPGAGIHGGEIVVAGTPLKVAKTKRSLTGQYLSGLRRIEVPMQRRAISDKQVTIVGASGHNLKCIDVHFPLGVFIGVTGVSGSGKSTLVNETLFKALAKSMYGSKHSPAPFQKLIGLRHIDKIIDINQSPIGRTPRSNPATYTGAFTLIRDLFAGLPESRARGYKAGRYSFNVKGGRCEACEGDGIIRIEMHFLPDVYVTCEQCKGQRYNRETLEVYYKGRNIAEVLAMTVDEAAIFLETIPTVQRKLRTLQDVGLGYIKLGQSATTLSGGEAQRIKLSKELSKRSTGRTLYILDEPTTGLHFADIEKLLQVLHSLVKQGNTVVVIEHNLDVIKTVDHIIDLGPEGGDGGGQIVVTGSPEQVAQCTRSYTGKYLRAALKDR